MLNNAEQMEKDGFNGATITQLLMIILPKTSTLLYPTKVIPDFTDFPKDFKHSGLLKTETLPEIIESGPSMNYRLISE